MRGTETAELIAIDEQAHDFITSILPELAEPKIVPKAAVKFIDLVKGLEGQKPSPTQEQIAYILQFFTRQFTGMNIEHLLKLFNPDLLISLHENLISPSKNEFAIVSLKALQRLTQHEEMIERL